MKLKKIITLLLVTALLGAFAVNVSAADVALFGSSAGHGPHDLAAGAIGVYVNVPEEFNAFHAQCPSYGNGSGTIHFGLYAWQGDYDSTIESGELASKDAVDFPDNALNKFEFPTAPAGAYLIVMTNPKGTASDVGVWTVTSFADAFKEYECQIFSDGAEVSYVPEAKIVTGKSASLGSLAVVAEGEEALDIGVATTSVMPVLSFEEKIADSIVMYTGSSNAFVGAQSKLIDKYNKNVKPVVIDGCTMLPIRFIAENLGTSLNWDGNNQVITMVRDNKFIEMQVGSKFMKVDNKLIELQVVPQILYGRTMIPLRAVTEALNIPIHWRQDGANGLIIIGETCEDLGEDLTVVGTLLSKLKMK